MATIAAAQETLFQKLVRVLSVAYPGSELHPADSATDDEFWGYLVWDGFGAEPAGENRAEFNAVLARELSPEERKRVGFVAFWHPGRWELHLEEKHHS